MFILLTSEPAPSTTPGTEFVKGTIPHLQLREVTFSPYQVVPASSSDWLAQEPRQRRGWERVVRVRAGQERRKGRRQLRRVPEDFGRVRGILGRRSGTGHSLEM